MMSDDLNSRSLSLIVVEVSFLITLNVMSLIGNTLVCISVYKNARLRTTTNLYIIALAASDLLSAVFVMPISVSVLITGDWILGGTLCQLHAFFSLFVIYVSPVTMGLTAVNRYVRICKSDQQYKRLFSARKSCALLASVWSFVACYTVVPRLFGLQAYEFVPGYAQCSIAHLSETGKSIHYGIVVTLFFLTPLISTTFSYTKVAKMIRKHNASATAMIQRRENARERSRKWRKSKGITSHEIKLSKSLFAVVFAFMICWVPFWIIVILRRFRLVAMMPRNVELFCIFLFYLSNTINPFIYAGMNPAFRTEFRKIVLCKHWHEVEVADNRKAMSEDAAETPNMELFRRVRRPNFHHDTSLISLSVETSEICRIKSVDLGLGLSISATTCL
ncbi:melatonin receptor type 1B-B-like [Montipora foliosa]|uniref:melatonin receptor type 1B-B-like n=1 Tax=Montipora foliosa TaxID=591990 RepID=UPI0035F21A67